MSIHNNYPNFSDFIKNELESLNYISSRAFFEKDYPDLATAVSISVAQYTSKSNRGVLTHFDFHASFVMEVEKVFRDVLIGANVRDNFDECSYFLAVTNKSKDKTLIRKFHFDYSNPTHNTNQLVPAFHLQYGGKLSPRMQNDEMDGTKLDHWLSIPRLNYTPINLALLLDLTFCEFRTPETNNIVETSEWRDLIYKNEKILSSAYFRNIYQHIESQKYNRSKLLRDFYYGV